MAKFITLILVGLSVGLGNFAASIAIGLRGVNKSLRAKIAVIFGLFETAMPIIGLVLGRQLAERLGSHANEIGGALLGLAGLYIIISAIRQAENQEILKGDQGWSKLLIAGLALSVDNLIVGFSLGAYKAPLVEAAVIIGITSVALALVGLELGARLGVKVEEYSELLSGAILILVGVAVLLKII